MVPMVKVPIHKRLVKGKVFWQVMIDRPLHRQFKARCVLAGKTMNQQVEEMIRSWLKKAS